MSLFDVRLIDRRRHIKILVRVGPWYRYTLYTLGQSRETSIIYYLRIVTSFFSTLHRWSLTYGVAMRQDFSLTCQDSWSFVRIVRGLGELRVLYKPQISTRS